MNRPKVLFMIELKTKKKSIKKKKKIKKTKLQAIWPVLSSFNRA